MESIFPNAGSSSEENKEKMNRCVQLLIHACQCRDSNCRSAKCDSMKRAVGHTKVCKMKVNGHCWICKQLVGLCFYHAKHCQDATNCAVPICSKIKQKIQQHRRMTVMNSRITGSTSSAIPSSSGALSPGNLIQNSSSASSTSVHHLPQLHSLNTTLRQISAYMRQQSQARPNVSPIINQPQQQQQAWPNVSPIINQPQQQQMVGGGGIINQGIEDAPPPSIDMNVMQAQGNQINAGNRIRSPQYLQHRQALRQLVQTIRLPRSRQQHQQVLQILGANPQLVAAFREQRRRQQQLRPAAAA